MLDRHEQLVRPHHMKTIVFMVFSLIAVGVSAQGNTTIVLGPGKKFEVICSGGTLTKPPRTDTTWSLTCEPTGGTTPPPVDPTPPPSQGCGQPASGSLPLRVGQEAGIKMSDKPVVRYFCSDNYPRGTDLSWGPYSASSFAALTMIISTTPGETDPTAVDRNCFQGSPTGRMLAAPNGGCRLRPRTMYYFNMTATHPSTGRPTAGGVGQLVLFNAKK